MPTLPNVVSIASGNCTKTKAFQIKLQRQSYSHGDQTLNVNMTHTGNNISSFVLTRMCDQMCPTLVTVLEFLHVLRKRNLGYSVLNSARGMLSSFATIEGYDAGKRPLVCRYMEGVYNINPFLPKRSFTWDAGAVVRFLSSATPKPLLDISHKLASLLAILCGQRGREILSVMDIRNTTIEENFLIIRIDDQLKTTGIKFHVGETKFPVYENANVCPVKLFKQYIVITKTLSGSKTCLFITTSKPYRPASKDTLAKWIKSALNDAGIDDNFYTALNKIGFNKQNSNKSAYRNCT